jgi:hypothetical protein
MTSYTESVLACADTKGQLNPHHLASLLKGHGATMGQWLQHAEEQGFPRMDAEEVLIFLGY